MSVPKISGKMPLPVRKLRPIPLVPIPLSLYSGGEVLDLDCAKNNWYGWKAYIEHHVKMSHLWPYLIGSVKRPNEDIDTNSANNFDKNDLATVALLESKTSREEQAFIQKYSTMAEVWQALCERHEREPGAYAQAMLIQELLNCRYVTSERFSITTLHIQELINRVFKIGLPTAEAFTTVVMLNSMSGYLQHLQFQVSTLLAVSSAAAPYTSVNMVKHLDMEQQMEQQMLNGNAASNAAASYTVDALAATMKPKLGRNSKVCTNPGCPHLSGHMAAICFAEGGGMAGKQEEYMAAKRKWAGKAPETAAITTSGSSMLTAGIDQHGCSIIVDQLLGKAYILTSNASSAPSNDADYISRSPILLTVANGC